MASASVQVWGSVHSPMDSRVSKLTLTLPHSNSQFFLHSISTRTTVHVSLHFIKSWNSVKDSGLYGTNLELSLFPIGIAVQVKVHPEVNINTS